MAARKLASVGSLTTFEPEQLFVSMSRAEANADP
jgi:hypothetical protein